MAILTIPINSDDPNFSFNTVLDDQEYNFNIAYNIRSELWDLNILNSQNEPIASTTLITDYPLFNEVINKQLPPGELFLLDVNNSGTTPNLDNLGTDFILIYIES